MVPIYGIDRGANYFRLTCKESKEQQAKITKIYQWQQGGSICVCQLHTHF